MNLKLEIELSNASLLHEVDALKKQIDEMPSLPKDVERRIAEHFRLLWSYHSIAIKGNKLSYNETKAFLAEGTIAENKSLKDYSIIQRYDEAISFVQSIAKKNRLMTETDIRHLHQLIAVDPDDVNTETADGTQTGEIYRCSIAKQTPVELLEFIDWYMEVSANPLIHPIVAATMLPYKLISTHPFDEGNKSLSRILMNAILMQNGYPPVIILLSDSQHYYSLLNGNGNDDFSSLLKFVVDHVKYSQESLINWKNYRYQVSVNGVISAWSKNAIQQGFKVQGDERRTLDLFCWYSELEIPIGATFNYFEKNSIQIPLKKDAVLIAVTQQFGKPFDVIPEGWKTIAKFEFSEDDVTQFKSELPILDSWTHLDDKFYLIRIE